MSDTSKKKNSPRKTIKRLFSKLKIVKPEKQTEIVMSDVVNANKTAETNTSQESQILAPVKNHQDDGEENAKKKFKTYCDGIEKLMNHINNHGDLSFYLHKYPQILQKTINVELDELQGLLTEIGKTVVTVRKLKNQRRSIKNETSAMRVTIKRFKDNETRELESIISRCDKDLYNRWMNSKLKPEAMRDLMFDVQVKQVALESLSRLLNRCLERTKESNIGEDEELEENKLVPFASSNFSFESKTSLPPPIPSIPLHHSSTLTVNTGNKNNARLSWAQRRFRAERRGNFAAVRSSNNENETCHPPLNVNNLNLRRNNANNNPFEFNPAKFSSNSVGSITGVSNRISNSQFDSLTTSTRQSEDDHFRAEMQSILQTLFGGRPANHSLTITDSNDSCVFPSITEDSNNIDGSGSCS